MTKPSNMNRCGVCTLPMADTYQKAEYVKPTRGVCLCLLFKFQLQDPYRGQSLRRSVAQSDKGKGKGQGKIQIIDDKDGLRQRWASESAYVASCERGMGINDIIAEARAHGRLVISPHIINANVQDAKGKDADKGKNKGQDKDKGKDEQIECDGGANDNAMPEKDDDDLYEIMGEMDQKSTSEIMGKSDDTSEKGSDWRGYMDEERNRIGGATGMGRPFTASCEGAMGINDTIALEEDAACTATPVRRQSVVSNLRRSRWYWKNEAKRLRAALEKEQRKENVDPKPRGQRIAVQKTSTKPRGKQSAVQKTSTNRMGKQSAQDKGKDKDKDKGKDDDPEVATGAMASVPDAVMRPGVAADAIVAAPDEAFPWWRHPCPPEILSQGEGSRAYRTWWMKRYRAKQKAKFL